MKGFQRYEYKELGGQPESSKAKTDGFEPSEFDRAASEAAGGLTSKKTNGFRLDSMVTHQLGLEKKEQAELEKQIRREYDKRWEQMKEQAEAEGYSKGLEEGKQEAYKAELPRINERLEAFNQLLLGLDKTREKIFSANEMFLMDIISQVARMVVLKEIEVDHEYIHRLVIALLQQLGTREDLKIYLSEKDAMNIQSLKDALGKEFGKLNNTTVEVARDIQAGGCRIETRFGVVDASIQSQIDNIARALRV